LNTPKLRNLVTVFARFLIRQFMQKNYSIKVILFDLALLSCLVACQKSTSGGGGGSGGGTGTNSIQDSSTITIVNTTVPAIYFTQSNGDSVLINSNITDNDGTNGVNYITYQGVVGTILSGTAKMNFSVLPPSPFVTIAPNNYLEYYDSISQLSSIISWNVNDTFKANKSDTINLAVPNNYFLLTILNQSLDPITTVDINLSSPIPYSLNVSQVVSGEISGGIPDGFAIAKSNIYYAVGYFPFPNSVNSETFGLATYGYNPNLQQEDFQLSTIYGPWLINGVVEINYPLQNPYTSVLCGQCVTYASGFN